MSEESKPPRILFLDDDELALRSLRALFSLETDYEFVVAQDPHEALKLLDASQFDLILSDYLMPKMNGLEFLKEARHRQPDAVRMLLTGFADKENAIRAINEVGLYQYLEKPWSNDSLLITVRNALHEKSLRQLVAEKVRDLDRLRRDHLALTERHEELEKELAMAARVQRSLLPACFPTLPGYQVAATYHPSAAVGGDYYDYACQQDNTIFLLSDVSGHGVQAAMINMLLKAIFQDEARQAEGPADLLRRMDARLSQFLPEGIYAAAGVVWMASTNGQLELANAGLPSPFILRGTTGELLEPPLTGVPLALFGPGGPCEYDCRELELAPGDVLLLGSDGLGDVSGAGGEFFQDHELRASLRQLVGQDGDKVIQGLLEAAGRYSNGRRYPDDVCLLAFSRL